MYLHPPRPPCFFDADLLSLCPVAACLCTIHEPSCLDLIQSVMYFLLLLPWPIILLDWSIFPSVSISLFSLSAVSLSSLRDMYGSFPRPYTLMHAPPPPLCCIIVPCGCTLAIFAARTASSTKTLSPT